MRNILPACSNYALSANGAAARASNSTPGHPPESTINGIATPAQWNTGEGWECGFIRPLGHRRYYDYDYLPYWHRRSRYKDYTIREGDDELSPAWLEIELPRPKTINSVIVHYPAQGDLCCPLGDAQLWVWYSEKWATIADVKDGIIIMPTECYPKGGIYEFEFSAVETKKVRLFITRGGIIRTVAGMDAEENIVRILEVEITGPDVKADLKSDIEELLDE